jgi:hypothetical protein
MEPPNMKCFNKLQAVAAPFIQSVVIHTSTWASPHDSYHTSAVPAAVSHCSYAVPPLHLYFRLVAPDFQALLFHCRHVRKCS